ncbi:unnamed protein product [Urochloa humidicola]
MLACRPAACLLLCPAEPPGCVLLQLLPYKHKRAPADEAWMVRPGRWVTQWGTRSGRPPDLRAEPCPCRCPASVCAGPYTAAAGPLGSRAEPSPQPTPSSTSLWLYPDSQGGLPSGRRRPPEGIRHLPPPEFFARERLKGYASVSEEHRRWQGRNFYEVHASGAAEPVEAAKRGFAIAVEAQKGFMPGLGGEAGPFEVVSLEAGAGAAQEALPNGHNISFILMRRVRIRHQYTAIIASLPLAFMLIETQASGVFWGSFSGNGMPVCCLFHST